MEGSRRLAVDVPAIPLVVILLTSAAVARLAAVRPGSRPLRSPVPPI